MADSFSSQRGLAPYAVQADASRGRLHAETPDRTRSPFQRDRDRIVHSRAFRRLQYKTQVFIFHEGDHYRTRLTHSIEVAQIARSIARRLRLDEDLAEALALAHDLGHPPFGHAGEDALDAAMRTHGGFDHNAQSLKHVTQLERRYAAFDGLNLTWETLEGLAKHNGPVRAPTQYIAEYDFRHSLDLASHASAEAQVAAIADDIAYNNHDLEDGLRAHLFSIEEVAELPLPGAALDEVKLEHPGVAVGRLAPEMVRRVISRMIQDVVAESQERIEALDPADADAIRAAGRPVVGFSPSMAEANKAVRAFLFERMYRHWRVNRTVGKCKRVVQMLFQLLHGSTQMLPPEWRARAGEPGTPRAARVVCDYIAGMTDRFALEEYKRLTDPSVPG